MAAQQKTDQQVAKKDESLTMLRQLGFDIRRCAPVGGSLSITLPRWWVLEHATKRGGNYYVEMRLSKDGKQLEIGAVTMPDFREDAMLESQ